VMLMHADSLDYKHQCVGYATSQNIEGPYEFKGPILYNGQSIRKWDMGSFQDDDGSGYLIIHSGLLYKLSDDYKSITEEVVDNKWHGSESPAIFKKDGIYFWLASDLTSWERNDNFYYTATSLKGPWTAHGNFAPAGTLTWNSQTSFVLPITGSKETTYLFMGDRWSYPYHATSATYVWQPLMVSGTKLSIPQYQEAWKINTTTGKSLPLSIEGKTIKHADKTIAYTGKWQQVATDTLASGRSDIAGDSFSVKFNGTQAGFYGILGTDCGYARVVVTDANGKEVASGLVDMYSKYRHKALMYLSPVLKNGAYTLTVSVMGFHGSWTDKKKVIYGSTGNYIAVNSIIINK
ncbi:MAG: glycosyl hydrolase family 43, partial [Sphingobacteriales bacterium]